MGAGPLPVDRPAHPRVAVRPLDPVARGAARTRQAELLKPPGALGRLEDLALWLAGCTGDPCPRVHARVVVAAADHGVAGRGVSAYPPEVTRQMLAAFGAGHGALSALAAEARAEVVLVDAGVVGAPEDARIRRAGLPAPSRDLATEPALTVEETARGVDVGRALAAEAAVDGVTVLVGGDMGIGNTTPATALACWLTGRPPSELTGPGTGLDPAAVARKAEVIATALALHRPDGPLAALRRLGGGELAVLCGLALGAGEHGLALVLDGLVATAAAAVAVRAAPGLEARLLAGHRSPEPAHGALLESLGLAPVLDLGMRLGEGSGALTALGVLRAAAAAHAGMATFAEAGVTRG